MMKKTSNEKSARIIELAEQTYRRLQKENMTVSDFKKYKAILNRIVIENAKI